MLRTLEVWVGRWKVSEPRPAVKERGEGERLNANERLKRVTQAARKSPQKITGKYQ